jgi:hypothetical protein
MSTKQKTTTVSIRDIVGCSVVEKASQNDAKRWRLSILTTATSKSEKDRFVNFRPVRFVFEGSDSENLVGWRKEIMKLVEEVKLKGAVTFDKTAVSRMTYSRIRMTYSRFRMTYSRFRMTITEITLSTVSLCKVAHQNDARQNDTLQNDGFQMTLTGMTLTKMMLNEMTLNTLTH